MSLIKFVLVSCLPLILYRHECNSSVPEIFKGREICKDDVCLKDETHPLHGLEKKFGEMKLQKILNNKSKPEANKEKSEYTIQMFDSDKSPSDDKSDHMTINEFISINKSENLINLSSEFLNNVENVTELPQSSTTQMTYMNTEYTSSEKEISVSTLSPAVESTAKSMLPVQKNPSINELSDLFNLTKNNEVCFCDMLVDECDINCCCDKDCNFSHWKVFVKCIEKPVKFDLNYCFKNNLIFKNNLKMEVVQSEGGLFCIVKDNMRTSLKYKTKKIIKSLSLFNKAMPKKFYSFINKKLAGHQFRGKNYQAGSFIWIIHNGEIKPLGMPTSTIGLSCLSEVTVKYLIDDVQTCSYHSNQNSNECEQTTSSNKNLFHYLKDLKIIATPHLVNKSVLFDVGKICQNSVCVVPVISVCQEFGNCTTLIEKGMIPLKLGCANTISKVEYNIWHNGSEGITKFEVFVWLRISLEDPEGSHLQRTKVNFLWVTSTDRGVRRSGNPGYLIGKPLLTARKLSIENGTSGKTEVMDLTADLGGSLSVLGSEMGMCSLLKRIPINFHENSHYSCSLKLLKNSFDKDNCIELQKTIFKLLLGEDITNITSSNYFNKYVSAFGNPNKNDTRDWVQVLVDLLPIVTSQVSFKQGYNTLVCRNLITDLMIDVAYSNVGFYLNPQTKILGVSFQFGKHKDFLFYCDTHGCEKTKNYQYFKLSTFVHFTDLTEPANDAFAEPLGLEVKLPHDFFYPFFSMGSTSQSLDKFVSGLFLLTLLKILK